MFGIAGFIVVLYKIKIMEITVFYTQNNYMILSESSSIFRRRNNAVLCLHFICPAQIQGLNYNPAYSRQVDSRIHLPGHDRSAIYGGDCEATPTQADCIQKGPKTTAGGGRHRNEKELDSKEHSTDNTHRRHNGRCDLLESSRPTVTK